MRKKTLPRSCHSGYIEVTPFLVIWIWSRHGGSSTLDISKKSLIIRADANQNIGSGHIMRTLALAQHWIAQGGHVHYAIHPNTVSSIVDRLKRENCKTANIDAQPGSQVDAKLLTRFAKQHNAVAIVIDGYHFDSQYLSAVRSSSWKTLVLDDDLRLSVCRVTI